MSGPQPRRAVSARSQAGGRSTRDSAWRGWGALYLLLGIGTLANAGWMLAGPMHWYAELPAAVPDTGPFNPHFVRDIGCAFLAAGVALCWAAFAPAYRLPLVGVAATFLVAHALLHVYDTLRGALPADHWWLDAPGVYLPAALLAAAFWNLRREQRRAPDERRME